MVHCTVTSCSYGCDSHLHRTMRHSLGGGSPLLQHDVTMQCDVQEADEIPLKTLMMRPRAPSYFLRCCVSSCMLPLSTYVHVCPRRADERTHVCGSQTSKRTLVYTTVCIQCIPQSVVYIVHTTDSIHCVPQSAVHTVYTTDSILCMHKSVVYTSLWYTLVWGACVWYMSVCRIEQTHTLLSVCGAGE
jgi:hypothetical protein